LVRPQAAELRRLVFWGRLVESAVGAHIANAASTGECQAFYWRERNHEVDFVTQWGKQVTAIEVKSGRTFPRARTLLVGSDAITVEAFLSKPVGHWTAS
jgi:predicted AAA+ superfamily ATPase